LRDLVSNSGEHVVHRRVAEREPLLHEVDAQHRAHRKRRPPTATLRRVRRDKRFQLRPRHDSLHLRPELALALVLGARVQSEFSLLHGRYGRRSSMPPVADLPGGHADLPQFRKYACFVNHIER
jgi:hypothetical protein